MKTYKIYANGGFKIAVKQGWSWPGFFFTFIWAFTKGLVAPGIVCLIFCWPPALIVTAIICGSKGNNWWEAQLMKSGYAFSGIVQAGSPAEAITK